MNHGVRCEAVSVVADGTGILSDVTVTLDAPRIAVIGANGSGKSTFARVLGGLISPSSGSVLIHGADVVRDRRTLRRMVGMVFSNPDAQVLMPTPREDLELTVRAMGQVRSERTRLVDDALAAYGLVDLADAPAATLSGGQKQLLAIAAVAIRSPSLLIADEPTTQLDLQNSRRISDLLLGGVAEQTIIVTHDLVLARSCDLALRFEGGRLHEIGAPDEVVSAYERACA